jgi:hypothetical protein
VFAGNASATAIAETQLILSPTWLSDFRVLQESDVFRQDHHDDAFDAGGMKAGIGMDRD